MDIPRDIDVQSTASSETRSLDTLSSSSLSFDQKREKSDIPVENEEKLSLIEKAIHETIAEQNVRSKEITELLSVLDIDPNSFSKAVQETWNKVASILRAEGLSEVDETRLKLKMWESKRERGKKAREERNLKSHYNDLCERHQAVLKRQAATRQSTDDLQKFVETEWANNEQEYANRIFTATKMNDFRQTAQQLQERLDQQLSPDLFPDRLLQKYETYVNLLEESEALDQTLHKYNDLPPNLAEAKLKIKEKESYLKDLERTIYEKMNS